MNEIPINLNMFYPITINRIINFLFVMLFLNTFIVMQVQESLEGLQCWFVEE